MKPQAPWLIALLMLLLPAAAGADAGSEPLPFALFPGGTAAESITTPAAYSAYAGLYYLGAFGVRQVTFGPSGKRHVGNDAAMTAGLGLGQYGHGVTLAVTMANLSEANDIYFSAKWQVAPETRTWPALGVGMEDIFDNVTPQQAIRSSYVVATRTLWDRKRVLRGQSLLARTTLSLGYGDGRFHNQPFASVATSLSPQSEAIVERDHWGTNVGLSAAPWRQQPGVVVGVYGMRLDSAKWHTVAGSLTYVWSK